MIRLADPAAEYQALRTHIDRAVADALASGSYILGPLVDRFETEAAAYLGAPHAIGVSNGTDAIVVALSALGIGPGDEVIVPAFSFIATAGPIARVGARPVFADVDPTTMLLRTGDAESRIGPRTRAIVTVHLFGRVADVPADLGVPVIEDAAQAFGAGAPGGRAGTRGAFGTYSFFPAKPLGAAGDAGLVVTADAALAARVKRLRAHGAVGKNRHDEVGGNYRMDPLQAAILSVKLRSLDVWLAGRQKNADALRALLADVSEVVLPADEPSGRHAWAQFVIQAPRRDELAGALRDAGVETAVYYPIPLPLQPCFSSLGHRAGEFPGSERAAASVLALPIHPMLSPGDLERVASTIRAFYGHATR